MKTNFLLFFLLFSNKLLSQSLGGNAVFNFLQLPNCTQAAALGGIQISNYHNIDVGLAYQNPSLLRKKMNSQINASFNNYFSSIKNVNFNAAKYIAKNDITLGGFINYFNYGNNTQTDASGNILGNFSANEYVVQLAASKQYKENWFLGTALKFASSKFSVYHSNAIGLDIGLSYYDTTHQLQISFVVKNLGTQLKKYDGITKEELPFDVQWGITKKLAKAPLQFSITAHHLQKFNLLYNDTLFKQSEGDESYQTKKYTLEKVFSHLIFSAQLFLSDKIEITTGYNFLTRQNLNVYNTANGLNGFSLGFGALFKKFHFRYATGFYQKNMFHYTGINFSLQEKL